VEFSLKINLGRSRRIQTGYAEQPDSGLKKISRSGESLAQRGFRQSGLRKILFSKNLDTKILITNRLAGQVSLWADRHCLDHDRAIRIRGARSDVTMGLWKSFELVKLGGDS
jgi:hypothetical protein